MTVVLAQQLALAEPALVQVVEIDRDTSDDLLTRWGHYLGPCRRPFAIERHLLVVLGEPVATTVSASTVSEWVPTDDGPMHREHLVELARICSGERWATRVMLRIWREVLAPAWHYWPPQAAVAYSRSDRHEGRIYRFDGWTRWGERRGSSGGGTWTKARSKDDPAGGPKVRWGWRYAA